MIPLSRRNVSQRAISYTRQTLPRPARLYSTPTKSLNAPELISQPGPSLDYASFMPTSAPPSTSSIHQDMHGFLRRRAAYTILPTPTAHDALPGKGDFIFPDSPTQDQVAIMDACLRGLLDVPRAKRTFELLRESGQGEQLLHAGVYNTFLEAFLELATSREQLNRANWLEDLWALYDAMESGREKVAPTANTYALVLQALLRFGPESVSPVVIKGTDVPDATTLLRCIINRQIAPTLVVCDRAFTSDAEATEAIRELSKAAVHMGLTNVINELGLAESLGKQVEDPRADVPEVIPVMKAKVSTPLC